MHTTDRPNKVLVLTGATAVGKTALAVEWARRFDGEIVNADSRQIYIHMDIGTAKPTPAEQAAAPHHMLDLTTPDQTLTLAEFQERAYAVIDGIHARGNLPILSGGTGLYITAILEGWNVPEVPPNPELRADLEKRSNAELLAQLQHLDPVTAERIDANNPRRLVRAVEVCLETGRPFSELRRKTPPGYNVLPYALHMPREALYARADARVDQLVERGWLEEVRQLMALGFSPDAPAISALGYPQILAVLRGEQDLEEAVEEIRGHTHRYIRRQYTWMRGHEPEGGWQWITHADDPTPAIAGWLSA